MQLVRPILDEQWIVEGQHYQKRPDVEDSLYVAPILNSTGLAPNEVRVLHSLVLDNNVFSDLVESRRPENNKYIKNLLLSKQVELNPVYAMIEQRQKFTGATSALNAYAQYLENEYGWSAAKIGIESFDAALASAKEALTTNIDLLSGYIGATIFLYHQNARSSEKLEWLSGLIKNSDLPYFQLQFYFAALVFLSKEKPELFRAGDLEKIRTDMKIANTFDKQKKKVMNLSNDLALPAVSIFPTSSPENLLVWPYIATRDKLVQLFLSQVTCGLVEKLPDGRANGAWQLKSSSVVKKYLGHAVDRFLPLRHEHSTRAQMAVRKVNLQIFSDQYIQRCVDMRIQANGNH
jgi:hypothetical protein